MKAATARLEHRGLDVKEVIGALDGFYCYNVSVALWADAAAILNAAAPNLRAVIDAYEDFLDHVRGKDDVSHHLVTKLLGKETHRLAEVEAAQESAG